MRNNILISHSQSKERNLTIHVFVKDWLFIEVRPCHCKSFTEDTSGKRHI